MTFPRPQPYLKRMQIRPCRGLEARQQWALRQTADDLILALAHNLAIFRPRPPGRAWRASAMVATGAKSAQPWLEEAGRATAVGRATRELKRCQLSRAMLLASSPWCTTARR